MPVFCLYCIITFILLLILFDLHTIIQISVRSLFVSVNSFVRFWNISHQQPYIAFVLLARCYKPLQVPWLLRMQLFDQFPHHFVFNMLLLLRARSSCICIMSRKKICASFARLIACFLLYLMYFVARFHHYSNILMLSSTAFSC